MINDKDKVEDETVIVTVRLPADLVERIDDEAMKDARTRSNMIRKKLEESTPKKNKPAAKK